VGSRLSRQPLGLPQRGAGQDAVGGGGVFAATKAQKRVGGKRSFGVRFLKDTLGVVLWGERANKGKLFEGKKKKELCTREGSDPRKGRTTRKSVLINLSLEGEERGRKNT